MEIALNTLFLGFNPKIIASHKQPVHGFTSRSSRFSPHFRYHAPLFHPLISQEYHPAVCAVISGAEDVGVSSSQFDDFSVAATSTSKARELKDNGEKFTSLLNAISAYAEGFSADPIIRRAFYLWKKLETQR